MTSISARETHHNPSGQESRSKPHELSTEPCPHEPRRRLDQNLTQDAEGILLGGHADFLAVLGPSDVLFLNRLVHGIRGQHALGAGDVGLDAARDDGDDLDAEWGEFWIRKSDGISGRRG